MQQISSALGKLEEHIKTQRLAQQDRRQQKIAEEQERQEASSAVLRFESEAERQKREEKERELREFGEICVAFRLSKPSPEYIYCGQIADLQAKLCSLETSDLFDKSSTSSNTVMGLTDADNNQASKESDFSPGPGSQTTTATVSRRTRSVRTCTNQVPILGVAGGNKLRKKSVTFQIKDGSHKHDIVISGRTMSDTRKLTSTMQQPMPVVN